MKPATRRNGNDIAERPLGARAGTAADAARDSAASKAAGASPRPKGIEVRISYAGECSLEEAVSRYLAAKANARAIPALAEAGA